MEFDDVINEHLELQRRNAQLEQSLPLERYRTQPTTRNDPPRNRQAEAVPEETEDFSPGWLSSSEPDAKRDADSSRVWGMPPVFDWGE